MKRLKQPTGTIDDKSGTSSDSASQVTRSAILVHAGPEGQIIEFQSGDGPIKFDAARIKRVVDVHNAKLEKLAVEYGGLDKIPMGAYEPILDTHDDKSNDKIIGRLTGALKYEIRNVPKVGNNVPCAVAEKLTFLGDDTVKRVLDGRIYHLSIGINEKDDSLGETSTVAVPAATGAMLLSKGNSKNIGGIKMSVQLTRMKAHTERLAKLSAIKEGITTLTNKTESTSSLIRLEAKKNHITHRLRALCQAAKMTPAEYRSIISQDKLTKLSKMDDDSINLTLSVWEARQAPVVHLGQRGSTSASDVMEFGKKAIEQKINQDQFKRLRAETKRDMIRMAGGKRLFAETPEDPDHVEHSHEMSGSHEEVVTTPTDPHAVPAQAGDEAQLGHHQMTQHHLASLGHYLESGDIEKAKEAHQKLSHHLGHHHLSAIGQHLESGNIEEAKKTHAELSKHLGHSGTTHMSEYAGDIKSEDTQAHMTDVQGQLDEIKTNMSRLAGMVEEMMGAEEKEGQHFGEISSEHKDVTQE